MAGGVNGDKTTLRRHGRQFFVFGLVGVFNTITDFSVYAAGIFIGLPPALANIVAFMTANPLSYFINSRTTFRVASKPAPISYKGYAKFLTAHLLSLVISTALVGFLAPQIGPFRAKILAVVVTALINYSASAIFVFRR